MTNTYETFCRRCNETTEHYINGGHCKCCKKTISAVQAYDIVDNTGLPLIDAMDTARFKASVYKLLNTETGEYYIGSTSQKLSIKLSGHISYAKRSTSSTPLVNMLQEVIMLDKLKSITLEPLSVVEFTLDTRYGVKNKLMAIENGYIRCSKDDPLCLNTL